MNIGEFIKKTRKKKELSINQLALYSEVSAAHISRIERGLREPSPEVIKKIAPVLKVPYEELLKVAGYLDEDTTILSNTVHKKDSKQNNSIADELSEEIHELSPESQKDLKKYIELLKMKDMQDRNTDNNDELATLD